jgi:hypothetical protein
MWDFNPLVGFGDGCRRWGGGLMTPMITSPNQAANVIICHHGPSISARFPSLWPSLWKLSAFAVTMEMISVSRTYIQSEAFPLLLSKDRAGDTHSSKVGIERSGI